jgi:hypothetical protein
MSSIGGGPQNIDGGGQPVQQAQTSLLGNLRDHVVSIGRSISNTFSSACRNIHDFIQSIGRAISSRVAGQAEPRQAPRHGVQEAAGVQGGHEAPVDPLQQQREAALEEFHETGGGTRGLLNNPGEMKQFFRNHIEVVCSEGFWSASAVKQNVDNFGSTLAITLLENIEQRGEITQEDLQRLDIALCPTEIYNDDYELQPALPALDQDLVGEFGDHARGVISDSIYRSYFAGIDSPFAVNMSNDEVRQIRGIFTTAGPGEKAEALIQMHQTYLQKQYCGPDNLLAGLLPEG